MTGANGPHAAEALRIRWAGVAASAAASLFVVVSWWAWGRFATATETPVDEPATRWVIGAALWACTLLVIRAQRVLAGGDAGHMPTLAVGVIMGGLVAGFGVTLADAVLAVAMAAVIVVCLVAPRRAQAGVAVAGFVLIGTVALWLAGESWSGATRPWLLALSYGNQWRHVADVWEVVLAAWLLGGLALVGDGDRTPVLKIVFAALVIETALILIWPVSLGHFAATMLVPALVLSGRGWRRLRAQAYSNPTPVLRGLLLILTVGLIPWVWTPLRAVGWVLTVAMFGD